MVYYCFTGGRIWASLGRAGIEKSHTTSGENLGLQNYAVADKRSIDDGQYRDKEDHLRLHNYAVADEEESHTTLGEIVGLHNCAVADITPQLQRERMITYDVT